MKFDKIPKNGEYFSILFSSRVNSEDIDHLAKRYHGHVSTEKLDLHDGKSYYTIYFRNISDLKSFKGCFKNLRINVISRYYLAWCEERMSPKQFSKMIS